MDGKNRRVHHRPFAYPCSIKNCRNKSVNGRCKLGQRIVDRKHNCLSYEENKEKRKMTTGQNRPIMNLLEELIQTAKGTERDLRKFEGGNAAAGTRVRWEMQDIRRKAKKIRAMIIKTKKLRRAAKLLAEKKKFEGER